MQITKQDFSDIKDAQIIYQFGESRFKKILNKITIPFIKLAVMVKEEGWKLEKSNSKYLLWSKKIKKEKVFCYIEEHEFGIQLAKEEGGE